MPYKLRTRNFHRPPLAALVHPLMAAHLSNAPLAPFSKRLEQMLSDCHSQPFPMTHSHSQYIYRGFAEPHYLGRCYCRIRMGVALDDHDRGPEVLNAFILFHNIPSMKTPSMAPSGISRSLGIPNRRGGNAWSTTSKTIVCPAKIRPRLLQNDSRPHAGRSAVSTAANTTTV